MIQFRVGVFQLKRRDGEAWYALIPTTYVAEVYGSNEAKLRERMIDRLRQVLRTAPPRDQELFQLPAGTELVRVPVELKLEAGRVTGEVPLVIEPRWIDRDRQRLLVYHPRRTAEWFLIEDRDELAAAAPAFLRHHWRALDGEAVAALMTNGKDRLVTLAFSAEPRSLLDDLPSRKQPTGAAAATRRLPVLAQLGVDETRRAATGALPRGVPRSPYRERLSYLLAGARPRSAAVVGPPGSGKTMLLRQWVYDRMAEDGHALHNNLDRVAHVWRITGKRMIAGMSHLGEWEERCLALLEDARRQRAILWIEDLHLWGRLGQSRQSERSFADFFRGPVRRHDLALVAELTPEQHARLERDAPGLAEALAPVVVPAASAGETARLLLHEVRALEARHAVALHPFVPRTALELGAALFPWRARPGVAIEIVQRVVAERGERGERRDERTVSPDDVLDHLARTTGLSPKLITLDEPLDPAEVEAGFAARVIGQPAATRAAADVILRVRAGLADPGRPINVMLFTGPTGTGKTELATAIAEYLYGGGERLIRIDMGELSGPDAVARLIGDRWSPDGLLTSRVRAQPFCVVLLDEIEKAHPQALHLLLQLFDEGRLTDAAGEVTSFASAVIVMTSNLGARSAAPIGFGDDRDRIVADVARAVREFFPVELFNRIDQVVAFQPLTPEVAARVVDKELGKLLGRRGLRERNTFVYAGAAVRRRAVADAFDPRYGARTVKRWLEDQIGGALTDLLATAPPSRLRIVRLTEDAGKIVASLEPLEERAAVPGPYLLEGALDVATAALDPMVAEAAAAVDRIRRAPALAEAAARADGELRYYIDELHQRLAALAEQLAPVRPPDGHHDDEDGAPRRARDRAVRPVIGRDARIAAIAEALRLERALPELLDPDAHAVTVVISRIGRTADAAGLGLVTAAIAEPSWLDCGAAVDARDGGIARVSPEALVPRARSGRDAHAAVQHLVRQLELHRGDLQAIRQPAVAVRWPVGHARDVALVLRGLFVRAALAGDHGTWMIRAAAAEPDVIRVEVRPGAPADPEQVLRAHLAARAELERVLEHGGALPPNPDALLPVTRTLTYRAPLRPGEPYHVELEDFSTGWIDRGAVREPTVAILRARHLAWSRRR